MSDSLRANETEDVLSSIRRLVSAEPRSTNQVPEKAVLLSMPPKREQPEVTLGQGRDQPKSGAEVKYEPSKLVLGPGLRVADEMGLNPLLLGRKPQASASPAPAASSVQPLEASKLTAAAPEPEEPDLDQPKIAFAQNVTAFPKALAAAEEMQEAAPEAPFIADDGQADDSLNADWANHASEEAEDAPFVEIEDDLPILGEVAQFPTKAGQVLNTPPQAEPQAEPEAAPEPAAEAAPQSALEPEAEEDAFGHWSGQSLPEVGWIAEAGSEWDEDESVSFEMLRRQAQPDPLPELAPEWVEQAEAEVRAVLQAPTLETGELVSPMSADNMFQAPTLDDESLRDIVRQIIREELSGALGERITRNVRKLVRIEVNRALTNSTLE